MRRVLFSLLAAVLVMPPVSMSESRDPLGFLQPTVVVSADDRKLLDGGQPVAHVLSASGREIAVWAAVRVEIDEDRLVAWMRRIDALKKSPYVESIGRFSTPPAISDVSPLKLDDGDVADLAKCHPGACDIKLSGAEMRQLQASQTAAGRDPSAVQQAFRAMVVRRVDSYLSTGDNGLPAFEDRDGPVRPAATFATLLEHFPFLSQHAPLLAEHLRRYPDAPLAAADSYIYWSKEKVAGKANISATHVTILRSEEPGMPQVLVTGKNLFATHYMNASLSTTALLRDGDRRYLVYVNRSDLDLIGGMFGGIIRWAVQRRLRSESADLLLSLKRRLEAGDPPGPLPTRT
jgi:hypothetical protein